MGIDALRVECYAGYRGEETPRRFQLGDCWINVVEVVDRWIAPDHRYFKLRGDDNATYILRYDVISGNWEMTMFERDVPSEGPLAPPVADRP